MHPDQRRRGRAIRKQRRLEHDRFLNELRSMSAGAAIASLALSGLGAAFAQIARLSIAMAAAQEAAAASEAAMTHEAAIARGRAAAWARPGSIAYMEIDGVPVPHPLGPGSALPSLSETSDGAPGNES